MKLFNKDGQGAAEIVAAVGLIANDITFDKWEPVLPFGIRDVVAIVGHEPVAALAEFYENDEIDSQKQSALKYLQQAVAFFTWLKIIPTLDAQHDTAGRSRRLGENEKGLTALQEFKDEENILSLAYEATDALVETLEVNQFPFWVNSHKYKLRNSCLIHTKEQFDEYYSIGSYRLFITLLPIMREVQQAELAPVLGNQILSLLLERSQRETDMFGDIAARAVVLFTMQKAVERLPVEVIPDGVVQVQQSQPVKSRLKAEQSARMAVAASLGADARRCIERLQQLVAENNAETTKPVPYIGGPIIHSKGLSF